MAPSPPRLRILSVGGNAVSAFLSWRLQATNACDVTLVWKSGFESVSQYGISFKSKLFGNERFKPRHVVRTPEDAASKKAAFDYVLLCVKALPDVYDLAAVIESVVTPQHTCILVNTTHTLGVEAHLEERFPTNVVLSLVSGAELIQLGASEFEHLGATDVWVGPANQNTAIPATIQNDMAEALAMTLSTGHVDCKVSENIRQQQYERMIGPIAFHPASVLFETPAHSELISKVGVRALVSDVIDELLALAKEQGCRFTNDFKEKTMADMVKPSETNSIMYQDFAAKRPMEVETYLGSPIKLAQTSGVRVPRIETLYALLHHINIVNQTRPVPTGSPKQYQGPPPLPRHANGPLPRPPMNAIPNGAPRGGRAPSINGSGGPPMRRGPPPMNGGYPPRTSSGYNPRGPPPNQLSRRPSYENTELGDEFSHLVLYDDIPEGGVAPGYQDMGPANDIALRERELILRQRELQLKEQEYNMRRGGRGGRRPPPSNRGGGGFDDDDDDEDDFFDPMSSRGPPLPQIDPDNFDMMSVTSRRTRKAPSASQLRNNPEGSGGQGQRQNRSFGGLRPGANRNRASTRLVADVPGVHDSLLENPLMGYSSDRYGAVDRKNIHDESRANSLTRERLAELQGPGGLAGMNGAYPSPAGNNAGVNPYSSPRRSSISPGDPFNPGRRPNGRPSPPAANGYLSPNGMPMSGRPSPPGMRQPIPRHPPGQGNAVAPQQVEQHAGVSNLYPPKGLPPKNVRSLTGSASASAGSGDSGASALIDSENSAHSSQSSLGPRAPIGVR
ncbi:hypothetical protein MMC13_004785 [Lambiella insularis]|nr:hypothetical protein [Lambiella insularis]